MSKAGLYGVKLHPAYQNFQFGDERYYPVYQAVCDCGLPLLLHAGRDPVAPGANRAASGGIARVARAFPRLTIIAAHMVRSATVPTPQSICAGWTTSISIRP
ncbi:MAG: amidohydrolase family protein [Merdibacter sp.]